MSTELTFDASMCTDKADPPPSGSVSVCFDLQGENHVYINKKTDMIVSTRAGIRKGLERRHQ
jgi:hypothetical protein